MLSTTFRQTQASFESGVYQPPNANIVGRLMPAVVAVHA
jgi:hypothetical protein